jgi:hypothetical protein
VDGDDLGESEPSEPPTLAEIFTQAFPYYLAMGMTYDEFWHGAPSLVRAYRKAYDIKRHEKNYELWMQGRYIFEALRCAPLLVGFPAKGYKVPSDAGYPDMPYPLSEKEAEEREIMRKNENTKRFIAQLEAESKRTLEKAKKEAVKDDREYD